MKKYKLLKDLPFAKAGEIFKEMHDDEAIVLAPENWDQHRQSIYINEIENFDEWFEETQELKKYYYIGSMGHIESAECKGWELSLKLRKSIGNYFETREEAEKYLEYLKAKVVIKQDVEGFNPDWEDKNEDKWYGIWDIVNKELSATPTWFGRGDTIYFQTEEDIKESFKNHPEEWKTYLTYEQ